MTTPPKTTKTGKPLGDHATGYARPPESGKWKPGQSGNPRGRKRKQEQPPAELLRGLLRRDIAVREGNEMRSIPYLEAFFTDWSNKALSGKAKDKADFYKALRENFPAALQPAEPEPDTAKTPVKPLRLIYPEPSQDSGKPSSKPGAAAAQAEKGDD